MARGICMHGNAIGRCLQCAAKIHVRRHIVKRKSDATVSSTVHHRTPLSALSLVLKRLKNSSVQE